jgi:hypothetical protein
MKNAFGIVVLVGLLGARTLSADVWDQTTDNDDDTTTNNALMHGTDQVHDLGDLVTGAGDRDWYNITVRPFSSYEVVVEGQTGDLNFDGASIPPFPVPRDVPSGLGAGGDLRLRAALGERLGQHARQHGAGAGAGLRHAPLHRERPVSDPRVRLDLHDPEVQQLRTQVTVFLIQNATESTCNVNVHYFAATGSNLASTTAAVAARGLLTLQTASVVGGQSGSARVTHDCGYGGLSGKAVALEPSTGFTFDTAMAARPR